MEEPTSNVDSQLHKLTETMTSIQDNFNNLHQGILGKIGEYDSNLKEVGSSVKAMDQVFKNILPSLTDSVNKLSRISNGPSTKAATTQGSKNPFVK